MLDVLTYPYPAAFDYHFGALDDAQNELSKSMDNLLYVQCSHYV